MYLFIAFLILCAVAISVVYFREKRRSREEEKEKADGKWDFVGMEYLPYLQSFGEVRTIEKVSFTIKWDSNKWVITGALNFNPGGLYARFDNVGMSNFPSELFIWGKVRSGRFKARDPLWFHSMEDKSPDMLELRLRTKESKTEGDYVLSISKLPTGAAADLKQVFV